MATTDYWDYYRWGTGTTATTSANSTSSYGRIFDTSGCSSASGYTWRTVTRKILVTAPKNWTEEQNLKFVELVNYKTKTGWIVQMVIKDGQILITDPDVERREMIDFVPLLKNGASLNDIQLINKFFDSNPP